MNWSEIFRYDDHTGRLHWKTATNRRIKIGCEAGTLLDNGYLGVGVNKKRYLAHRIIWDMNNPDDALQHGEEIDHIDHDKLNNRLHNLRKVTKITNHRNRPKNKNNTSGTTGVSYHKNHGRWYAQIMEHGMRRVSKGRRQKYRLIGGPSDGAVVELHSAGTLEFTVRGVTGR